MEAVIGEERGECGSRVPGIVVRKFRQGKEIGPICLLIVAINAQVLFEEFRRSVWPSVCGWNAVDRLSRMPRSSMSRPQKWEVKIGSLSLMRVSGRP